MQPKKINPITEEDALSKINLESSDFLYSQIESRKNLLDGKSQELYKKLKELFPDLPEELIVKIIDVRPINASTVKQISINYGEIDEKTAEEIVKIIKEL